MVLAVEQRQLQQRELNNNTNVLAAAALSAFAGEGRRTKKSRWLRGAKAEVGNKNASYALVTIGYSTSSNLCSIQNVDNNVVQT